MNDPRLTAYAVGELDPAEREAFERELATSADLQRELAETVALSDALTKSLAETGDGLDEDARRRLAIAFAQRPSSQRPGPLVRRAFLPALAACLIAMLTLVSLRNERQEDITQKIAGQTSSIAPSEPEGRTGIDLMTAPTIRTKVGGEHEVTIVREFRPPPVDLPATIVTEVESEPIAMLQAASPRSQLERPESLAASSKTKDLADPVAPAMPVSPAALPMQELLSGSVTVDSFDAGGRAFGFAGGNSRTDRSFGTEAYDAVTANTFRDATGHPLSTFSIDVDTASYANVRRFLNDGQLPPAGAVRIEEFVNYFPYALPQPEDDAPFSITTDVTRAPWNPNHLLARIALKGRDIATGQLPPSNLVFLVDVSGSMQPENKLPLLKRALRGLVDRLSPGDTVAIVTYAGTSGLVLPPTEGGDKTAIVAALDRLESGGSTNGAGGIQLAYEAARKQFLAEGNNRVILCTDGDFNVGITSQSELVDLIERERKSGVFLSVLGLGTGNVKDSTMEKLADKGNGNYAYIDSPAEARKVLVEQMGATLFTIAKDVKIQVEFNPATVAGYRLIGYENRLLAKEDFNDDTKDAGEIGAGHTVTALYEIVPAGQKLPNDRSVDPLKYQPAENSRGADPAIGHRTPERSGDSRRPPIIEHSTDLFTVKLRYKQPDGDASQLLEKAVGTNVVDFDAAPADLRFATAAAAFAMRLRGDDQDMQMDWNAIQRIARGSLGDDAGSYRAEFLTLVERAKSLGPESDERK